MAKICISILLAFCFFIGDTTCQDLTGFWQGVLYQGPGGTSPYFKFSMALSQQGMVITGSSRIETVDGQYFGAISLTGAYDDKNQSFTFQEIKIDSQLVSGFYWCIKNGKLNYLPSAEKLEGKWSAGACSPGSIELWRLKLRTNDSFCQDDTIQLSVTGQNIRWYTDYQLKNLIQTGNDLSPNLRDSKIYYVTQTHFSTESPAFPIKINVYKDAAVFIKKSICAGQSYEGYSKSGIHTDAFKNSHACDSLRTLDLTVITPTIDSFSLSLCQGESYLGYSRSGRFLDTLRALNGCDSIIRTVHLDFKNDVQSERRITICQGEGYEFNGIMIDQPGKYSDTLSTIYGCDSMVVVFLEVAQYPFLGNDTVLCSAKEFTLLGPTDNTLWFDFSQSRKKSVHATGRYWATIVDTNGCSIMDSINVEFKPNVYMPSAFSPNNDGINDYFLPKTPVQTSISTRIHVFNKWGGLMFYATDMLSNGWDGTVKGLECPPGTYFCLIEMESKTCPKLVLGQSFLLIR